MNRELLTRTYTRREVLLGGLAKLVPQSQEPPVTQNQMREAEAAIRSVGEASFARSEAVLQYDHPTMGITYWGQILEDFAREPEKLEAPK